MASLLPTISPEFEVLTQDNYLNRVIRDSKQPDHVWDNLTSIDVEEQPAKVGLPQIVTVRGLRAPNTKKNNVSNPNDLNAGIDFKSTTYEQFPMTVDRYDGGDYVDMFSRNLPIADKYVETVITLTQGAYTTRDFLARDAHYDVYTSGDTVVTANSANASATISVDNVRHFVAPNPTVPGTVSTANVTIGANTYVLASVSEDATSTSKFVFEDNDASDPDSFFGRSGVLTFTTPVAPADIVKGTRVTAEKAPHQQVANARVNWQSIQAGDYLTMKDVQKARNYLTNNKMAKPVLLATPDALYGLFRDPEFQTLYRGAYNSDTYETGQVAKILGVDIREVTNCPAVVNAAGVKVHFSMMVTEAAIIKSTMTSTMARQVVDGPVHTIVQDDIAFNTTAPIDAAGQFLKLTYLQWVGYAGRTDVGLTKKVVPTASDANYKRCVTLVSSAPE